MLRALNLSSTALTVSLPWRPRPWRAACRSLCCLRDEASGRLSHLPGASGATTPTRCSFLGLPGLGLKLGRGCRGTHPAPWQVTQALG